MAIRIPSQEEIAQFFYDIDELEGYSYAEWLDYMEQEYPNIDAGELYASRGENIVTGYRDIRGNFVAGEKPVIDDDVMAMIQESVDSRPSEIDTMNANIEASASELDNMSQAEKSANFMAMLKDKAENPEAYETIMMEQPEVEQFTQGALDDDTGEFMLASPEEIEALGDTPIDPLDPMQIGDMIVKYADDAGVDPTLGMLMAGIATKNPSKVLKKKDGMISGKNSSVLKSSDDATAFKNRVSTKAKGPTVKVNQPVSTANSTILRPTSPATVSAKNSRVLKQTEPKVSTKNSRVIKEKSSGNMDIVTKQANAAKVKSIANTRRSLSTKDKLIASGITSAAAIAALTNKNGLSGDRDEDGSLKPITPVEVIKPKVETKAKSKAIGSYYDDMPPNEKATDNRDIESKLTGKKGWKLPQEFEGSTTTGNYLSADFDDDYWNTPEGVAEAIGIWGKPVGNKIARRFN
jgi:hypothetical protein